MFATCHTVIPVIPERNDVVIDQASSPGNLLNLFTLDTTKEHSTVTLFEI
jgi:hypothetical protein